MRRLVPELAVALLVAGAGACGGDGGGNTRAFCDEVRELRALGRDPGSVESGDPQQLTATIAGLRALERSAPSEVEDDVVTIRQTLETIAALGEGRQVDPEKVQQLAEDDAKIRRAGRNIDRHVAKCGIEVPST
jgi:hypothetical protein